MAQQEAERRHDDRPEGLTEEDLRAENAAELPDREAMSLVSPDAGLRPGPMLWPGPVPLDTTQPVEP